jgi:hypothetical protein
MATEKEYTQDEMADWLKNKAKAVATGTARRKLLSFKDRSRDFDSAFVGNLYFFRYDPKHKATLPQYDKFPMAIILQWNSDGFLGLNLHYLPRGQRSAMLGVFSKYKEDYKLEKDSDSDNWENLVDFLDNTDMQQMPKQCLKRYLWSHVTSHFVEIYPDEYGIAVQLPVEDWVFKR